MMALSVKMTPNRPKYVGGGNEDFMLLVTSSQLFIHNVIYCISNKQKYIKDLCVENFFKISFPFVIRIHIVLRVIQ